MLQFGAILSFYLSLAFYHVPLVIQMARGGRDSSYPPRLANTIPTIVVRAAQVRALNAAVANCLTHNSHSAVTHSHTHVRARMR